MKKLVLVPMIAVAALGLTACKHDAPAVDNGSVVANDVTLNSEDANTTAIDDANPTRFDSLIPLFVISVDRSSRPFLPRLMM